MSNATYVEDLEQDPFDAVDFVERMAWRMTNGDVTDPLQLKYKFEDEIHNLQLLCDQFQNKVNFLERQLNADKQNYVNQLQRLFDRNSDALGKIKQLDDVMQLVSTKVIHLGDQLESVHQPRSRAFDALQLIEHFDEFLSDQPLNSMIFTDPDKLLESADLIHKLYTISQELSKDKFAGVQARISHRYEEVERLLMDEFARSQRDEKRMAEVAAVLSEFRGYSHCVDRYIEFIVLPLGHRVDDDIFVESLNLVKANKPKIEKIFPNSGVVLQKLVLFVLTSKIKEHISARLGECREQNDMEKYLATLSTLNTKTITLCKELEQLQVSCDNLFLSTLCKSLFDRYLSTYQADELAYLRKKCSQILARFYESKKHVKKQIQQGSLQELKRDVQARLLTVETHGGETFLSDYVAISILQETKNAFARVTQLCEKREVPSVYEALFDVLLNYLFTEHMEYALEIGLAGISLAEPKSEPPPYFFNVVAHGTAIMLLLIKQYDDSVMPIVKGTNVEQVVTKKWSACLHTLEQKINLGLERQINTIIGYVRFLLNADAKAEPRPDHIGATAACTQAVRFLAKQAQAMERGCDGANLSTCQHEVGSRLNKMLMTHYLQFVNYFDETKALCLVCDVNEYRQCLSRWKTPNVAKHLDKLHSLANLLVVLPDTLNAQAQKLSAEIDKSLIYDFIKLRYDYKSLKNISFC